jgi:hypothetical protein
MATASARLRSEAVGRGGGCLYLCAVAANCRAAFFAVADFLDNAGRDFLDNGVLQNRIPAPLVPNCLAWT